MWKEKDKKLFILWIIHAILCTRRAETVALLRSWTPRKKIISIKTKCYDSFEIPVANEVSQLISYIKPWFDKLSNSSLYEYIALSIPNKFRKELSPHGTRAYFRTVIDFITTSSFNFEAKEAYICHFKLTNNERAYARNKFLSQRIKLQKIWIKWYLSCIPIDIQNELSLRSN